MLGKAERQVGERGEVGEVGEVGERGGGCDCVFDARGQKKAEQGGRARSDRAWGTRTRKIAARVNEPPRGGGANLPSSSKGDIYYLLTPSSTCDIYYCHFLSVCLLV